MIKSTVADAIPINQIEVQERARQDYGADFDELKQSLCTNGLIQPIAIMKQDGPVPYVLLAGGRRLRAFSELAADGDDRFLTIKANVYEHTDNRLETKSIELLENIRRKDLTAAEATRLTKEIHDLQISIHGPTHRGPTAAGADPGWSIADTAKLLGESERSVARDIAIAAGIDEDPELANCASKHEIALALNRKAEERILRQISERLKSKKPAHAVEFVQQELCDSYAVSDCFDYMKQMRDSSVNFINLDWPYGEDFKMDKRSAREIPNYDEEVTTRAFGVQERQAQQRFMHYVLTECTRILKPNSWMLIWYFIEPWHGPLHEMLNELGYKVSAPLIWYKKHGRSAVPTVLLGQAYEAALYVRRGQPVLQTRPNVFEYSRPTKRFHPAEKPIELMQELLRVFTLPGHVCFDPFLGSGNMLLGAANLGERQAMGCDMLQGNKDKYIIRVHESKPGAYSSY